MRVDTAPRCIILPLALAFAACGDAGTSDGGHESPTGTFLDPEDGLGNGGYEALDETCEATDAADYLDRFATPMFRDVAVHDDVAFLVDGSALWAVSLEDPAAPVRLSLTRLPGRPISATFASNGRLLVAAGSAGILTVDVGDPTAPLVTAPAPLKSDALGIETAGDLVLVAQGSGGLAVVDASGVAELTGISQIALPGFVNAVAYDAASQRAYVAACSSFSIVDLADPAHPALLGTYFVPEGHAKGIAAEGDMVYVAGGEALFAFDAAAPAGVLWTGYYADPETPGFYVNAVTVRDGIAYIAAGDESVRAIDVDTLDASSVYAPPADGGEPPSLDDPIAMPDPTQETITIVEGDPINVALHENLLLVLGNFRWVGERLLRVMDVSTPGVMFDAGAYVQPNDFLGAADAGGTIVVHGKGGLESVVTPGGTIADTFELPEPVVEAGMLGALLVLLSEDGRVYSYDFDSPSQILSGSGYDLALGGTRGFVADAYLNAIYGFEPYSASGAQLFEAFGADNAFLGYSRLLARGNDLYAYDWVLGHLHGFDVSAPSAPHVIGTIDAGLCEVYDIADFYSGQKAIRAKLIAAGERLALLCPYDGDDASSIKLFAVAPNGALDPEETLTLPEGRYVDAAFDGGVVYALSFDNNTYRSGLYRLDGGESVGAEFDGHANGLLLRDGLVYVVDGDFGVRRFAFLDGALVEGDPLTW
jgi:hypothetical protein